MPYHKVFYILVQYKRGCVIYKIMAKKVYYLQNFSPKEIAYCTELWPQERYVLCAVL